MVDVGFGEIDFSDDEETKAKEATREAERGFTEDELATAIKVMSVFASKKNKDMFNQSEYRETRRLAQKMVENFNNVWYDGNSIEEYKAGKERSRQRNVEKMRRRVQLAKDHELLNKAEVRQQRIAARSALLQGPSMPLLTQGGEGEDGGEAKELQPATQFSRDTTTAPAAIVEGATEQVDLGEEADEEEKAMLASGEFRGKTFTMRACYICKRRYRMIHRFYDNLCPVCARLNFEKREQTCDLDGRVALVTGGRVKIGFHIVLKLLRAGAHVIATTRFPGDAARRYAKEDDFDVWRDRLDIYGLDLRDLVGLERFCDEIKSKYERLDMIVNNAAQTVRRPRSYYKHLLVGETPEGMKKLVPPEAMSMVKESHHHDAVTSNPRALTGANTRTLEDTSQPKADGGGGGAEEEGLFDSVAHPTATAADLATAMAPSAALSQVAVMAEDVQDDPEAFPEGHLDEHEQQVDKRETNSWRMRLHEVPAPELLETTAINMFAPFILNARLKELLLRGEARHTFVVNVSAMEGKFYRYKSVNHPHTNMAKAANNMMTRTSSADYAKDQIYMTSVDTGWITDENPFEIAQQSIEAHDFQTPIDEIDAAARVLDPIFSGVITGKPQHGVFLKDYTVSEW